MGTRGKPPTDKKDVTEPLAVEDVDATSAETDGSAALSGSGDTRVSASLAGSGDTRVSAGLTGSGDTR